jgi:hypothetical protein
MKTPIRLVLAFAAALAASSGTQVASQESVAASGGAPAPVGATTRPNAHIAWDWTGVIGTGQSLAVGQNGTPLGSTNQPYNNLKLYTGSLPWPIDPNNEEIKLVPLVEPDGRRSTSYPNAWPGNIAGETPHSAMANQITALVKAQFNRDFISIHSEVGENGQGMQYIKKNPTRDNVRGHAFEGSLVETRAITRLAKAAGKTFGVGAITLVHGESDSGNNQYESQVRQLWQDYNTDLKAITGQTEDILMIVSQQSSLGNPSPSAIAQWKIGVDDPKNFVCAGPKYQYRASDQYHLTTEGYQLLGEKMGEVYFERVILGHDWQPLQPVKATHQGNVITVQFNVPVGPMVWDNDMDPAHAGTPEWKNGKGFELMSGNQRLQIDSVEIKGDSIVITCGGGDVPADTRVSYALYSERQKLSKPFPGFPHWGQLRDSDTFKGSTTGKVQPNYCVGFQLPVQ